jgi:hypothetical protein
MGYMMMWYFEYIGVTRRKTPARKLIIYVLAEVDADLSLDAVEDNALRAMQHIDESSPTRRNKERSYLHKIDV